MENVSANVYAKFRCAPLRIKKALGIFREPIPTTRTRTTRVAFWDPEAVQACSSGLSRIINQSIGVDDRYRVKNEEIRTVP